MIDGLPPHKTLSGTYPEGKALPIAFATIKVNNDERVIPVEESDLYSKEIFKLKKGRYTLSTTLFDKEMKLTVRRFWAVRANSSIALIKPIVEEMGEEKAIEFLKSIAYERASTNGKRYKDRKGTDDFADTASQ